jgi:hypothetical protein
MPEVLTVPTPVLLLLHVPPVVASVNDVVLPANTEAVPVIGFGVGLTVMLKLCGAPAQPLANGVTVTVLVTATPVVLTAVKEAILPVPLVARPMAGLVFVHVKLVPVTEPVKITAAVLAPLHKAWFETGDTLGIGFTVTVVVYTVDGLQLALLTVNE